MESQESRAVFLDCPEYLDETGILRCGLPAYVEYWYTAGSSDGPLESAKICCPRGHWFNGPVEMLTLKPYGATGDTPAGRPRPASRPSE